MKNTEVRGKGGLKYKFIIKPLKKDSRKSFASIMVFGIRWHQYSQNIYYVHHKQIGTIENFCSLIMSLDKFGRFVGRGSGLRGPMRSAGPKRERGKNYDKGDEGKGILW